MTNYKKSLDNQIRLTDTLDPYYSRHDGDDGMGVFAALFLIIIGMVMGMVILQLARSCDRAPEPVAASQNCAGCHNKMASYFKSKGSRNPERMAYAVLRTGSPRLLAAMAVVESDGNSNIRNTGFKKRHSGAFQVNAKLHGRVPQDAVSQALQAETILNELVEHKPLVAALNHYGGESDLKRGKYAYNVLAELNEVPK